MESIQRMVPQDFPLVALTQQGAKAVGQINAAELSVGNHRGEPSVSNRSENQAKHAQSKQSSLASGNRHLAEGDAHQRITQNRR
jgi:hypothetical protein